MWAYVCTVKVHVYGLKHCVTTSTLTMVQHYVCNIGISEDTDV